MIRNVTKGFTRGNITIAKLSEEETGEMYVEFENENLSAVLKDGNDEKLLAVCPDLIQVSSPTPSNVDEAGKDCNLFYIAVGYGEWRSSRRG